MCFTFRIILLCTVGGNLLAAELPDGPNVGSTTSTAIYAVTNGAFEILIVSPLSHQSSVCPLAVLHDELESTPKGATSQRPVGLRHVGVSGALPQ